MLRTISGALLVLLGGVLLLGALQTMSDSTTVEVPPDQMEHRGAYLFGYNGVRVLFQWILPPALLTGGVALLMRKRDD